MEKLASHLPSLCSVYPTPTCITSVCCSSWLLHISYAFFSGNRRCGMQRAVDSLFILVTQTLLNPCSVLLPPLLLSSPTWGAWNRSCIARCVMRWWGSPSFCHASTVCVCCVRLRCWYKEVILLQTSHQSPTHRPPRPTLALRGKHGDPHPGPLTAWNGSSEQVEDVGIMCVRVCVWCNWWEFQVDLQETKLYHHVAS